LPPPSVGLSFASAERASPRSKSWKIKAPPPSRSEKCHHPVITYPSRKDSGDEKGGEGPPASLEAEAPAGGPPLGALSSKVRGRGKRVCLFLLQESHSRGDAKKT